MRLTLDPLDLRPEFEDEGIPTSQVRFKHFKPEAQKAIRAAGGAIYYTWERDNYNSIRPPKNVLVRAWRRLRGFVSDLARQKGSKIRSLAYA